MTTFSRIALLVAGATACALLTPVPLCILTPCSAASWNVTLLDTRTHKSGITCAFSRPRATPVSDQCVQPLYLTNACNPCI